MPARRRSLRRKACRGKRKYATIKEAEAHLKQMVLHGESAREWNHYPCGYCGSIHLGHLSTDMKKERWDREHAK